MSLRSAWEDSAEQWIEWSRSKELDHAFWGLNLPAMIELLPEPSGPVLDLGCGEGRVSRELKQLGYDVVGVEGSETLAAAAREADPDFEVHVADAGAIPLGDDSFDLVVASLMLMNVDDLAKILDEVARVLRPGGALVASLPHPVNSLGDAGPNVGYFNEVRYSEMLTEGDAWLTLHETHRPLSAYTEALADRGFVIERLVEPQPDAEYLGAHPDAARWLQRPAFMHFRARL
jgi:SAM-dependent methyltransferase